MIVYNVKRRWFTMKADAEAYRKAEGLPPSATFKLDIRDRDDLAALLNGLCGMVAFVPPVPLAAVPPEVLERSRVVDNPPDCVPQFLVKDWQQRHKRKEE
jgi:hypothetical protein